jgi:sarcosine oxidase delta subunit
VSLILNVDCPHCGFRNRMERRVDGPEARYVLCHSCEAVVDAVVTPERWAAALKREQLRDRLRLLSR